MALLPCWPLCIPFIGSILADYQKVSTLRGNHTEYELINSHHSWFLPLIHWLDNYVVLDLPTLSYGDGEGAHHLLTKHGRTQPRLRHLPRLFTMVENPPQLRRNSPPQEHSSEPRLTTPFRIHFFFKILDCECSKLIVTYVIAVDQPPPCGSAWKPAYVSDYDFVFADQLRARSNSSWVLLCNWR